MSNPMLLLLATDPLLHILIRKSYFGHQGGISRFPKWKIPVVRVIVKAVIASRIVVTVASADVVSNFSSDAASVTAMPGMANNALQENTSTSQGVLRAEIIAGHCLLFSNRAFLYLGWSSEGDSYTPSLGRSADHCLFLSTWRKVKSLINDISISEEWRGVTQQGT